jgi:23S rRNA pseudouridine1911/1915/1917 synthase
VDQPSLGTVSTRLVFTVPEDLDGARLDRCLADVHPEWTRSRSRKLIDGGHVVLNDQPAKASARVRCGDRIVVDEPPAQPLDAEAEDIPLEIVFEDEDLLVIDKPAGLVIHPAAGNPSGTLVNALLHHCTDLSGIGGVERPGIVHRLDKDTTGLLVAAKTDRAHLALSLAFRNRKVHKTYLAVCYGTLRNAEGVIDAPIDRHPRNRQHMAVVTHGRPARTLYTVRERLGGTALVECRPVTGRTHQIRVHMAHIGHALIGDPVYSGRQWRTLTDPKAGTACRNFPRQALHAWRLEFTHPVTREVVTFEAPPPGDFEDLVALLRGTGTR